jgi:hypothetical protein
VIRSRSLAARAALLVVAAAAPAAAQRSGARVSKDIRTAPARPAAVATDRAAADRAAADRAGGAPGAGALPLKYAPRPTAPAITAADLMSRLYAFADDSMMGREAGTEGNLKAAAFLARELQRLGLRPAGEGGTYFQDVPFVRRTAAPGARLVVDGRPVDAGDFVLALARGTPRAFDGTAAVVFGGAAGQSSLTREQAAGKVVLLRLETLGAQRIAASSPLAAAAAVVYAGPDRIDPALRNQAPAMAMAAEPGAATVPPQLFVTRAVAERMLGRAARRGDCRDRRAAGGGDAALRRGAGAGAQRGRGAPRERPGAARAVRGARRAQRPRRLRAPRRRPRLAQGGQRAAPRGVRGPGHRRRRGAGPAAAQQVADRVRGMTVNVDSLRRVRPARPDSINNGADDDGSGSMALLEIAENLAAARARPKRSVLFVWHTAEEKGLLGSRWYADHPTVSRDSIVAQLNIDMIGRGGREDVATGGPTYVGIVGSRRLSTELGDLAAGLARQDGIRLDYALDANGHPQNIYCRSDHYHYARYGIPIAFFFTGLHGDYHQVTDEPQYIDYPHYARITNYVRDLAVRVADLDHRVAVDKPKPDPNGECRQ